MVIAAPPAFLDMNLPTNFQGILLAFTLGVLIASSSSMLGQELDSAAIHFSEQKHHFDTLQQGPSYDHEFSFTNTGKDPFVINRVVTPCQCLTPDWPEKSIKPGDTGSIKVTYFSDNRPGSFFKSIKVQTSIAERPLRLLYVEGYVREDTQ